jgi:hypothetical protein
MAADKIIYLEKENTCNKKISCATFESTGDFFMWRRSYCRCVLR